MFGASGVITIVLALGTAVGLLLLVAFGPLRRITRIVTRSFWCPVRDEDITAEFLEDAWDGKRLEINQCTAFTPPTAITCEKLCLHLARLGPARMRVS